MSIHIKMSDGYKQVTTYYGGLDNHHPFIVEVSYDSNTGIHDITSIEFLDLNRKSDNDLPKEYWSKSKEKIKDFVMKWLFKKPENQGGMEDE